MYNLPYSITLSIMKKYKSSSVLESIFPFFRFFLLFVFQLVLVQNAKLVQMQRCRKVWHVRFLSLVPHQLILPTRITLFIQ